MKKITLLSMLILSSCFVLAQQQQYVLDFEVGSPEAIATNWLSFGGNAQAEAPTVEIVTNPDPDGVNTDATGQVMRLTAFQGGEFFDGVNNDFNPAVAIFGTWELDSSVASNLSFSMDVNKNVVGTIGIKMGNTTQGTIFEIGNESRVNEDPSQARSNSNVNEWETLTWDLSSFLLPGLVTDISQMVIFVDWTENQPSRTSDVTLLVDNITWNANKLTDAPTPTCTDGVQNGDETGVDCGGTACVPCATLPPVAPQFGSTGTNLFVYSDLGDATNSVSSFNLNLFGNGTRGAVDLDADGTNETFKLDGVAFYGAQWDAVDLTALPYQFVHLDYYAESTSEFKFFLIDQTSGIGGGNPEEPRYTVNAAGGDATIVTGQWTSLFIPLSAFENFPTPNFSYDLTDIFQYKFETNGGVMYFDNVYFSTSNTLSEPSFDLNNISVSPNPTSTLWTINGASDTITEIVVYDITGKQVLHLEPNAMSASIDTAGLNSGIYLARINAGNASKTVKLVKI
jgi:hypothetical protein